MEHGQAVSVSPQAIVIPAQAGIQGKGVANCTAFSLGPGLRRGDDWRFKSRSRYVVVP